LNSTQMVLQRMMNTRKKRKEMKTYTMRRTTTKKVNTFGDKKAVSGIGIIKKTKRLLKEEIPSIQIL
jgi:hypothetical protein